MSLISMLLMPFIIVGMVGRFVVLGLQVGWDLSGDALRRLMHLKSL